jgi:protein required for attachment to host cells
MPRRRKLIYVIADGAHARFVEHSREQHGFVTVQTMDGSNELELLRAELRDEQAGRSFESATSARHGVGQESPYQRAKAAFAARTAQALKGRLSDQSWDGVVLVAPPRLLKVMRERLGRDVNVVAELGKDLIKTPDHELSRWLDTPWFR